MKSKAFTLIELLVVVLIIGILAAIAVPQYQKSVWRSKAKGMLFNLKSLHEAMQVYYLANGSYPTKLSDLDITFNEYTKDCIYSGPVYTADSCKANDDSNLFIGVVKGVARGHAITQFNSGPYRSAGFTIKAGGKITCYEHIDYPSGGMGAFCEKIMGCVLNPAKSSYYDKYFDCPDL